MVARGASQCADVGLQSKGRPVGGTQLVAQRLVVTARRENPQCAGSTAVLLARAEDAEVGVFRLSRRHLDGHTDDRPQVPQGLGGPCQEPAPQGRGARH
eukprot:505639-Lingulodinium_polyedra.AAC.1